MQGVSSRDDPPSAGVSGSHTGAGYGIYGENLASGLTAFFVATWTSAAVSEKAAVAS